MIKDDSAHPLCSHKPGLDAPTTSAELEHSHPGLRRTRSHRAASLPSALSPPSRHVISPMSAESDPVNLVFVSDEHYHGEGIPFLRCLSWSRKTGCCGNTSAIHVLSVDCILELQ